MAENTAWWKLRRVCGTYSFWAMISRHQSRQLLSRPFENPAIGCCRGSTLETAAWSIACNLVPKRDVYVSLFPDEGGAQFQRQRLQIVGRSFFGYLIIGPVKSAMLTITCLGLVVEKEVQ